MFRQLLAFRSLAPYLVAIATLGAQTGHGRAQAGDNPAPSAAAPSGETPAPAALFERGLQALQAGRNQEAIDAFTAAYAADGTPAALMNLGIAYTNAGELNQAVEALTRFVERADRARDAQTIAAVQAELERVRSQNGVVVLKLNPADAAVQVDGRVLSPLNSELVIAPGQRRFVVFADGYVRYDQMMAVAAGRFSLDVTLTPLSEAKLAQPAPAPSPEKSASIADVTDPADEPEPDATHCALSSVCFGPVLALIGPPNLIGGGVHFRFGEYFGAGVDYQVTPSISFDPVSVSSSLFSVNARAYPFGGAFFLGGGFGYQSVRGELSTTDVTVAARASFPAAMASVGFMGRDGFVMGMDLGVLFPLGQREVEIETMQVRGEIYGMTVPQESIDDARTEVQSQVRKVVDALPIFAQLNLLRIGYLF